MLLIITTGITDKNWDCPSFPGYMVTFLRGNGAQLLSLKMNQQRYKEQDLFAYVTTPEG